LMFKVKNGSGMNVQVGDQIRCRLANIGPGMANVTEVHEKRVVVMFEYADGKYHIPFEREDYCARCDLWEQFFPGYEGPHEHDR
jgi:hypothetical protein